MDARLLAFLGVALVVTITPGPDTMLIVRNVLTRGRGAGFLTSAGICGGLLCHATLAILGLSAILLRSVTLFQGVKLLGAAYLCYLGVRSLWQVWRERGGDAAVMDVVAPLVVAPAVARWRSVTEGFLSNILNPKVVVFYLAFLPQFINPGESVRARLLLLAALHIALGIVWLALLTLGIGWLRVWLLRPAIRRRLEAVSGAILIAFGLRLALEKR